MSEKSLKFGAIGCSHVAKKYFFPAIDDSEFTQLGFVGSRSLEKSKTWANDNDCDFFGYYDEVLESDVDAVYISLPISMHEEWVIKAAKYGKHILCEKSSTTSYSSAKNMVKVCNDNDVSILECLAFRFHPQHNFVKDYIDNQKLGKISHFYGMYGFSPPESDDIRWQKQLGGGILNDVTCYPICASRIVFDAEPESVFANFVIDENLDVDTSNHIMMHYSKNRYAYAVSGFKNYYQSSYSVWGAYAMLNTKRAYSVSKNFETSLFLHQNDTINEIKIPKKDQFQIMLENFTKSILNIDSQDFDFKEDLLNQAKTMEAIRISHKKKIPIFVDDIN